MVALPANHLYPGSAGSATGHKWMLMRDVQNCHPRNSNRAACFYPMPKDGNADLLVPQSSVLSMALQTENFSFPI